MLGPLLFVLYVADHVEIVDQPCITLHSFADNTQLYLHCLRSDVVAAAFQLQAYIADISQWMSANRLKLTGLGQDTASPSSRAMIQRYSWDQMQFYCVTTSGCSELSFPMI